MRLPLSLARVLTVCVAGLGALAGAAEAACPARGTMPILTVAGAAVTNPDRGGPDKGYDLFHVFRQNEFAKARRFTADDLAALPRRAVSAPSPYDQRVHDFEGPALADVLKAAGAEGASKIALQAIDGYEAEMTAEDARTDSPVLALCRDGVPLGIGDMGPLYTVIPLPAGSKPTAEQASRGVWALFHIKAD